MIAWWIHARTRQHSSPININKTSVHRHIKQLFVWQEFGSAASFALKPQLCLLYQHPLQCRKFNDLQCGFYILLLYVVYVSCCGVFQAHAFTRTKVLQSLNVQAQQHDVWCINSYARSCFMISLEISKVRPVKLSLPSFQKMGSVLFPSFLKMDDKSCLSICLRTKRVHSISENVYMCSLWLKLCEVDSGVYEWWIALCWGCKGAVKNIYMHICSLFNAHVFYSCWILIQRLLSCLSVVTTYVKHAWFDVQTQFFWTHRPYHSNSRTLSLLSRPIWHEFALV